MNYYENQLNNVDVKSEFAAKIKIKGGENGETKWMDLNRESATAIINWISQNFLFSKVDTNDKNFTIANLPTYDSNK